MTLYEPALAVTDEVSDRQPSHVRQALPAGTWLDEFEVGEVIAEGSAAIVYAATDDTLAVPVAIAEYMPADVAERTDDLRVVPRSPAHAAAFAEGLRAFVADSRVLARCDHPSLVRILRLRESNATAYRVMPRYTASSLLDVRRGMTEPPDEQSLRALLDALLGALDAFHRAGGFHGEVAPSNVLLLGNDRPLLLSPGGARRALAGDLLMAPGATSEPSFAPIEQLVESPDMPLGPSADLYALAGVARFWISGELPPPAVGAPGAARRETVSAMVERLRARWPQLHYAPWLVDALDSAASIYPAGRPQSVAQMRVRMDASLPGEVGPAAATSPSAPSSPGAAAAGALRAAPPVAPAVDAILRDASPAQSMLPQQAEPEQHIEGPHDDESPAPSTAEFYAEPTHSIGSLFDGDGAGRPGVGPVAPTLSPSLQRDPLRYQPYAPDASPAVVDVALHPEDFPRIDVEAVVDGASDETLSFAAERPPAVPARPPRRAARLLGWMVALFVVLALAAGGVYVLNKERKLDRLLDLLGIPHQALRGAPAAVPPDRATSPASIPATNSSAVVPTPAAGPSPPATAPATPVQPAAAAATPSPAGQSSAPRAAGPQQAGGPTGQSSEGRQTPAAGARDLASPRDACGDRTEFSLYRCMQTQCSLQRWSTHPQCERLRATDKVE